MGGYHFVLEQTDGDHGPSADGGAAVRTPDSAGAAGLPASAVLSGVAAKSRPVAGRGRFNRRHRQIAVHHQTGHARQLSLRAVRGPFGGNRPVARVQRHHRQTYGRRLHQPRPRHLVGSHGPHPDGGRGQQAVVHPGRLRLRPVHRRSGRALRRGSGRRLGHPRFQRQHAATDHVNEGFRHHAACLHPFLCVVYRRNDEGDGPVAAGPHAQSRRIRRRTLVGANAAGDREGSRHQGVRHLRPQRDHRPRRGQRMPLPERPAHQ